MYSHPGAAQGTLTLRSPARVEGQAAAWKRTRAWLARSATRSGPSTTGSWRSMPGRRLAATTGTPSTSDLAPGDLGAVDSHDRHHHAWVGQDLGGLVALERPLRAVPGRAGSGHATAARTGRAGGGLDTAWSRRRTPHRGRSPGGRGWPGLPGTARSCRTAHPCRSNPAKRRAVCRSPTAPRRQALASGLGRNRSPQPAATAVSAPTTRPNRGATRRPRTVPTDADCRG